MLRYIVINIIAVLLVAASSSPSSSRINGHLPTPAPQRVSGSWVLKGDSNSEVCEEPDSLAHLEALLQLSGRAVREYSTTAKS
jgi:hypothetical protein